MGCISFFPSALLDLFFFPIQHSLDNLNHPVPSYFVQDVPTSDHNQIIWTQCCSLWRTVGCSQKNLGRLGGFAQLSVWRGNNILYNTRVVIFLVEHRNTGSLEVLRNYTTSFKNHIFNEITCIFLPVSLRSISLPLTMVISSEFSVLKLHTHFTGLPNYSNGNRFLTF